VISAQRAPDRPDWQLFWIVKHGVRYSGMAAWDGEIHDEKIWQVVTFLSRLRNLPPDVEASAAGIQMKLSLALLFRILPPRI
jgi:mono/diheme cytochrome c family protein